MSSKEKSRMESQVRKERYKELLDKGGALAETAETADVIETLKNIQELMHNSNAINSTGEVRDRCDNSAEVVLDAQVIKMSHEILGSAMQSVSGTEFNDDLYISCLKRFVHQDDGTENWDKLNEVACVIWKSFGWSQGLLGTFDPEAAISVTQRKERQPRAQTQVTQQLKPESVGRLQQDEKRAQVLNVVMKLMMEMFRDNGNQAIPFYRAVIDPGSFMNSVDNCFQMAFLFRDGHLFLDVDSDGFPIILPVAKSVKDSDQFKKVRQMIGTLNPKLWAEMTEHYQIEEPLLLINRDDLHTSVSASQQEPAAGPSQRKRRSQT